MSIFDVTRQRGERSVSNTKVQGRLLHQCQTDKIFDKLQYCCMKPGDARQN